MVGFKVGTLLVHGWVADKESPKIVDSESEPKRHMISAQYTISVLRSIMFSNDNYL